MAGFTAYNQCFMLIFYDKKSSSSGPQLWTIIKLEFRRILEITTVVEVIFGGCSEVMSNFCFMVFSGKKIRKNSNHDSTRFLLRYIQKSDCIAVVVLVK